MPDDDVIQLNVGGTNYSTTRLTLDKEKVSRRTKYSLPFLEGKCKLMRVLKESKKDIKYVLEWIS